MDPVRIGVAGLGYFGPIHARIWTELPHTELVAVYSRSEVRAREVAAACGARRWYTDYEKMAADPDVDAVDVCTELARHAEIALAALRSGKHVFSEILLSKSMEEMDELIEWADRSECLFMVGFLERFDVRRAIIKRRIEGGELGQLVSLYGRRNGSPADFENPRDRPDPLILQPGIHTVDQMLWLADEEVREVYARTRCISDHRKPDTWWAMLTFESGLIGVIEQSFFVPDDRLYWSDVHLEVVGTQATAHITEPNDASWIWTPDATVSPDLFHSPEVHGRIVGALEAEMAYFADAVIQKRPIAVGTLQQARAALRVGLAIVESAEEGEVVTL